MSDNAIAVRVDLPPVIAEFLTRMNLPVQAGQFINVDNLDRLAADFRKSESAELGIRLWRGANLKALRDSRKGDFAPFLASIGMTRRSAYQHIDLFDGIGKLPSLESVYTCGQLEFSKLREISQWPAEELAAFTAGEQVRGLSLDAVADMSFREFKDAERQWKAEHDERIKGLESEKTRLETELNKYRQQARAQAALRASEDLPMFAREPREEALVASEAMMQSLELIDDAVLRNLLAEVDHPEALRWQPASARTVVYALAPVAMRIGRLIKELRERFGDSVVGPLDADSFLEPSEALQLMMGRAQLIKQAMELAQGRADTRANTTPGKRGRKRGSSADASA